MLQVDEHNKSQNVQRNRFSSWLEPRAGTNVVYTKEWLDALKYTEKGFKKFEPEELVALGREAGFKKIEIRQIVKGKSFAVVY